MEELQSTDILDREILEDAQKKALRILKACDTTIKEQTEEWNKKTIENINELKRKYSQQKETLSSSIMARLPIDKQRIKVERIDSILKSAVDYWYKSLKKEQILSMLSISFINRLEYCEDISSSEKKHITFNGISRKEAEDIMTGAMIRNYSIEEVSTLGYPSIALETEQIRITSSIQKIADYIVQAKRAELIDILMKNTGFIKKEA